jgi:hypothetical protein
LSYYKKFELFCKANNITEEVRKQPLLLTSISCEDYVLLENLVSLKLLDDVKLKDNVKLWSSTINKNHYFLQNAKKFTSGDKMLQNPCLIKIIGSRL